MGDAVLAPVLLVLAVLVAGPNPEASADSRQTLTGEYVWNQGPTGDLEAVFTSTGQGTWKVDFHFRFRDRAHTYSGTAEGDLGQGKLQGTVQNEDRRRTFEFSGNFKGGTFHGTHEETTRGRAQSTGTLTLGTAGPRDRV